MPSRKDVVESVNGNTTTVKVWHEYVNGVDNGYVAHYELLDLYSQGATPEEAMEGMRHILLSWARIMSDRLRCTSTYYQKRYYQTVKEN